MEGPSVSAESAESADVRETSSENTQISDAAVLLEENFDAYGDLTLKRKGNRDQGLYFVQNSDSSVAEIKDGHLYLLGDSFDNIYFRDTEEWTNYTLEADVCLENANGWGGLLFRMNEENSGQAAVVTPGMVSLKGILEPGLWYEQGAKEVAYDTGIKTGSEAGTVFRVKIVVHENSARLSYAIYEEEGKLSDYRELLAVENTFPHVHMTGGVGVVAADGCKIWIDNVRVTEGEVREEVPAVADIYIPESGIVNPPVVVQQLTSETKLPASGSATPAVAIMEIDEELKLVNQEAGFADVGAFLEAYGSTVIPALVVDSQEEVEALIPYLQSNDIIDVFVLADSENWQLVRSFRERYGEGRGILRFSGFADEAARKEAAVLANSALASVVLSETPLTEEDASFFNARVISAWSGASDAADVYTAISSGAAGVVTGDASIVYDIYSSITDVTVSGRPLPAAHRGHSGYPNNTILALRKAIEEANSKVAEIDLRLSKDGEIVLMHDATINKTTNGLGNVADFTVEELKAFEVSSLSCDQVDEIPTLEEVFQEFQEDDLVLACEMKGLNEAMINRFNELVEQYGYQDRVAVFMGSAGINRYNYKDFTDGVAYVGSHRNEVLDSEDPLEVVEKFLTYFSVYHNQPYFSGYVTTIGTTRDHNNEDMHYMLSARGFVNWRTTTNGQEVLDDALLTNLGAAGALTDDVELTLDYAYYIEADNAELGVGEALPVEQTLNRLTYSEPVSCEITQVDGPELVFDEAAGIYTLNEPGTVTLVYSALVATAASEYRVYSGPVTVSFLE